MLRLQKEIESNEGPGEARTTPSQNGEAGCTSGRASVAEGGRRHEGGGAWAACKVGAAGVGSGVGPHCHRLRLLSVSVGVLLLVLEGSGVSRPGASRCEQSDALRIVESSFLHSVFWHLHFEPLEGAPGHVRRLRLIGDVASHPRCMTAVHAANPIRSGSASAP